MTMQYIRDAYKVPARRGARVEFNGHAYPKVGTITGSMDARICVRMDGEKHTGIYHPTWRMRYLPEAAQAKGED